MKWTFFIRQKLKVAILLFSIMLLIIVTILVSRKNINHISESFNSMYNDRLIPATDIFYLAESLYSKRLLMENYLNSTLKKNVEQLQQKLDKHNRATDSLILEFEKTYLVDDESQILKDFKNKTKTYTAFENDIINLSISQSKEEALQKFNETGEEIFRCTIDNLVQLTQIQSSVGKKLTDASQSGASNIKTLYSVQMILVFVIGAMVQALIFASKSLRAGKEQKYRLN